MVIDINGVWIGDKTEKRPDNFIIDTSNLKVTGIFPKELTEAQIESACLSYRHDFGLLPEEEKDLIRCQCKWWFIAIRKEFE